MIKMLYSVDVMVQKLNKIKTPLCAVAFDFRACTHEINFQLKYISLKFVLSSTKKTRKSCWHARINRLKFVSVNTISRETGLVDQDSGPFM